MTRNIIKVAAMKASTPASFDDSMTGRPASADPAKIAAACNSDSKGP